MEFESPAPGEGVGQRLRPQLGPIAGKKSQLLVAHLLTGDGAAKS